MDSDRKHAYRRHAAESHAARIEGRIDRAVRIKTNDASRGLAIKRREVTADQDLAVRQRSDRLNLEVCTFTDIEREIVRAVRIEPRDIATSSISDKRKGTAQVDLSIRLGLDRIDIAVRLFKASLKRLIDLSGLCTNGE